MTGGDAGAGGVDLPAFRAMAAECGWSVAEFAAFYGEGARAELAALRAAAEAGDGAEVRRLAHGARGSSAAACVPGMAEAFHAVEQASAAELPARLDAAQARLDAVLAALAQSSA